MELSARRAKVRNKPMKNYVATLHRLLVLTLFLISSPCFAQTSTVGQFSCGDRQGASLSNPDVKFVEITALDVVKQWKSRPVLVHDGFDAAKYGFTRAEFYRSHLPVPGREGYGQGAVGASTDRLALAVHVVGPRGDRWFELTTPSDPNDSLLYIQERGDDDSGANTADTPQQEGPAPKQDEMQSWLILQAATPDAKLPLFNLSFWHKDSGVYSVTSFDNQLFLDLRSGSPRIVKALSCSEFEPIGGACSAQDQGWEGRDTLDCHWDPASNDFRCTMTSPYGGPHAVRNAQEDFYLLSDKPAKPPSDSQGFWPDLGHLALSVQQKPKTPVRGVLVGDLGPTTLLQRFKDLLPDAEVFVFASPGAGDVWNSHLSLVTVSSAGKIDIQSISKWSISGEETDESEAPKDFMPLLAKDSYQTHILEQRPGYRAFDAALTSNPGTGQPHLDHVLYWIGLEAVDGKLVASAVRVATDGYIYGGCGAEYREGTATSIRKKAGVAEATLRVQGQFEYEYTNPYPTEGPNCVWTCLLHWKAGAGFRARKLSEDCKAAHQEVIITEDGAITGKDAKIP
jgi:hypothetical protein